jgi:multidrug efflux system outer membrane protein
MDLPERFREEAASEKSLADTTWPEMFPDPALQCLIKTALLENRDLAVAAARIDEARAILGVSRSHQFPRLDVAANAARGDPSNEVVSFDTVPRNNFGVFGELYFEIDLWGRLRRATEAERAILFSTEHARRTIAIALVSDVARLYFRLLDLDERARITERTLKSRKESTSLIRARFSRGIVPELDVNQAEIEEAQSAADLPGIERERRQTENALSVLLGHAPHAIERSIPLTAQKLPDSLPVQFPAALLERRPDLLAAEELVKSAIAQVGVAEAERLPTLSLTGLIGLESRKTADLFTKNARTWGISGNLLGPLIDFGERLHQVEAADARAAQAMKSYEGAVLRAVQEVEDSLIAIRTHRAQLAAVVKQRKAAANAAKLSRARYDEGQAPYLEVLDSERSLLNAELSESEEREACVNAVVQLYKALGGGLE